MGLEPGYERLESRRDTDMAGQTIPNSGGRDRKGAISKTSVSTGDIIVAA